MNKTSKTPPDDHRSLLAHDQYRLELVELTPLGVIEEYDLAVAARAGDQDAAWTLIEHCLPYIYRYAYKHASIDKRTDPLDAAQAGSEAMVRHIQEALKARNVCAFLRTVARNEIIDYCLEDKPIRVPATSFRGGKRAPVTVSLNAALYNSDTTLLDLIAI